MEALISVHVHERFCVCQVSAYSEPGHSNTYSRTLSLAAHDQLDLSRCQRSPQNCGPPRLSTAPYLVAPGQTLETNPAIQTLESNPAIQALETNPANHLYLKPSPYNLSCKWQRTMHS